MMTSRALPPPSLHETLPIYDPEGDVLYTNHYDAFLDEGKPMINDYVRHVRVGVGQHGDVYLCLKINYKLPINHPERRIPVAMKSVKRNNPRAEKLKSLRKSRIPSSQSHIPIADRLNTTEAKIKREIAIMKKLRHPHVVRLFEVIDDRLQEKIYMVMEYLGGGEVKWRDEHSNPVLTVSQTRRILRDALLGLEYLHYQGIIHRDIKPANLLWSEDRRQVKIADFGVSHFSYAQRLAAAGGKNVDNDPSDPILLDESGLTRRAGTPSFLAPEVIYEHTNDVPGSISLNSTALQSSSSLVSTSPISPIERPEITKSIDVWALGVTFYCLLFGTTPFVASQGPNNTHGSEYSLYISICNDDWPAPREIGFDRIPSGGRHPNSDSEGASIIHLLDHFLQKDSHNRITLDEVKKHAWLLQDLDDPQQWLQITSPNAKINVSSKDTSNAMSAVRFQWRWGGKLVRHVSSLFRRPVSRLEPQPTTYDPATFPTRIVSDPLYRQNLLSQDPETAFSNPGPSHGTKQSKGKQKAEPSKTLKRPLSKGSKSLRSKSIERERGLRGNSTSTSALLGSASKARRGSDSKVLTRGASESSAPGQQQQPHSRQATGTSGTGEKRSRFWWWNSASISAWRPNKFTTQTPTVPDYAPEMIQAPGEIVVQAPNTRRSEEALSKYRPGGSEAIDNGALLTAARRASSWGHPGQSDNALSAEIINVPSIGYNLNEHDMIVGAGGVANNEGITASAVAGPFTPHRLTPVAQPEPETFGDRYGNPVYDDDSSTIASMLERDNDSWQRGSEMDDLIDDHHHDRGGEDEGGDGSNDEEEDEDEDEDEDDDDRGVVFAPRRHTHNDGEQNLH